MSSNSSLTGISAGVGDATGSLDEAPAPSCQPSSEPDEQPTTQPTTTSSLADPDRRGSEEIAAPSSSEASISIAEFSFPPDLQDPILSARRYRIVKELGTGSYGIVFLAWDERRQYASPENFMYRF